ncbi:MAG TPA: hypothetical protein VEI97_13635, partial [bacterium]|nr:hypothetical protein [bacterium]
LSGPDLSAQVTVRNGRRNPQAAPPAVSIGELQVQRGGSWETLWGESVTLRSGKAQTVTFGQRSLELRPGDRRLRFRVRKDATVLGASLKLEVQAAAGPKAWLEASETYGTGKTLHPGWRIDWSGLTDSWLEIDLLQATPGPSGAPVPAFPGGVHLRSLKLAANPLPPKEYQARLDANHGVTARLRQDAQTGASYLFLINDSAFTVRDVSISGAARQAIEAMAPYEVRILPVP